MPEPRCVRADRTRPLHRKAAGGVLTAQRAPRRPGTAPAPGLRAERAAVIRSQTATAKELPANANLGVGSARSDDLVSSFNPCYFKIQTIGNRESNGITPTNYSCRRLNPGLS